MREGQKGERRGAGKFTGREGSGLESDSPSPAPLAQSARTARYSAFDTPPRRDRRTGCLGPSMGNGS